MLPRTQPPFRDLGTIMPIYEYACKDCEIAFDAIQSMKEAPLLECPMCERKTLIKLFSVPNAIVQHDPKTIGELAERNSKNKRKGLEELASKVGGEAIRKSETLPWWRDGKSFGSKRSEKPIDTSKITNIRKYVENGTT